MLLFSIALMSGLKRQSVWGRMASMPGSSSFRHIAKFVKLYIWETERIKDVKNECVCVCAFWATNMDV